MNNPFRRRGIRSFAGIVGVALAVSVVAGLSLTHAVVPTVETLQLLASSGMAGGRVASMLFGALWVALLVALPLSVLYRLADRF